MRNVPEAGRPELGTREEAVKLKEQGTPKGADLMDPAGDLCREITNVCGMFGKPFD